MFKQELSKAKGCEVIFMKINELKPLYQDKAWLEEQYLKTKSIYEIAEICGCSYLQRLPQKEKEI